MYSQNNEDSIISNYFGDFKGVLLDIGANDGLTFSNSRMLIEKGWRGDLIEPSPSAYIRLDELCKLNPKIRAHNIAIGNECGTIKFYESGAHLSSGYDLALLSTIEMAETERWRKSGVEYKEVNVICRTWDNFIVGKPFNIDFITIDAEAMDWQILQQIDLGAHYTKCLCIEWNSKPKLAQLYTDYCAKFGLKEIHRNAENIIYAI